MSTHDTSNYELINADCNKIESDPFRDENKEDEQNENEVETNDEEKPDGDYEKENTPLLRSTKKRSLPTAGDKSQVQRIKRGRFSSSLSCGETKTGDESDISSYTPLRPHISSAQPTSSPSTGFEGDTNDGMEFIGGRSRTVVIYEQQRWQGKIIKERDMKQGRGRPRKQYLVQWKPSWVNGGRFTAPGLMQN